MKKRRTHRNVESSLAGAMFAAVALSLLLKQGLGLSALYPLKVVCGLVTVAWLIRCGIRQGVAGSSIGAHFGLANQVTLLRAVSVVLLLGLLGEHANTRVMWGAVVIAGAAGVTDALDGWLARRLGTVSDFGARFDMETDAVLIAVLALLAWSWDRAGIWVLLAGAARYVFVLGVYCCRWMRRELPPSLRRKAVCAVQVVSLVMCMAPVLTAPTSALVAATGVSALLGSFIIDTLWLARATRISSPE